MEKSQNVLKSNAESQKNFKSKRKKVKKTKSQKDKKSKLKKVKSTKSQKMKSYMSMEATEKITNKKNLHSSV